MPANRPTLAIIGAGRVGRALGRVLRQRGWRIGAVVTRSQKTARAAVRAIGGGPPQSRLDASALNADVILIATPDRSIATVAAQLARAVARVFPPPRRKRANLGGGGPEALRPLTRKTILHTNGALDRSVLAPLERLGAATGSLHPLQTFTRGAAPNLKGAICAIEGTPRAVRVARRIARDLGCIPVVIAPTIQARLPRRRRVSRRTHPRRHRSRHANPHRARLHPQRSRPRSAPANAPNPAKFRARLGDPTPPGPAR